MLTMEAWRLKMKPWRFEDLYHFDEEKDPDPHYVKSLIPVKICDKLKRAIRISIKLMRMRHHGFNCKFHPLFNTSDVMNLV
jgi:hypothetical protein